MGGRQGGRPATCGQRSELGRYNQGVWEAYVKEMQSMPEERTQGVSTVVCGCQGDKFVPLHRAAPALTQDSHYWASEWRATQGGS